MSDVVTANTSATISRPPAEVFAAVSDITRMGQWSPENTGGRWLDGSAPALGARFEGDNEAKVGPITLKRWTTVSEVTGYEPDSVFEFVAEGTTTWRFELEGVEGGTRITESFAHPPNTGIQRVLYNVAGSRRKAMIRGMEQTLAGLKAALEG